MSSKFFIEQRPGAPRQTDVNAVLQQVSAVVDQLQNHPVLTVDSTDQVLSAAQMTLLVRLMTIDQPTTYTLPSLQTPSNPPRLIIAVYKNGVSVNNITIKPMPTETVQGSTSNITITPNQCLIVIGWQGSKSTANWIKVDNLL